MVIVFGLLRKTWDFDYNRDGLWKGLQVKMLKREGRK